MKVGKTLALIGTLAATGVASAMAYVATHAPRPNGLRERARKLMNDIEARVRGEQSAPTEPTEPSEAPKSEEQSVVVQAEHALEHGAVGRARASEQSRKPHVAQPHVEASKHPFRAQRHG